MSSFELLCVTMHQNDFSKIKEMNINCDVVFANQSDRTDFSEKEFSGHKAKMITTSTRGVGINRNFALMYASADICLFGDDDVVYADDLEQKVVSEFESHPDADVIIFNLDSTDVSRTQKRYTETRKCGRFERMPWGAVRIAFRRDSVRKANVFFSTLFGGGCVFPSGEDSMWLTEAKRKGLVFYVSKEVIGQVSFDGSTWFTGYNEKFFYGKGAFYEAVHKSTRLFWQLYFSFRTRKMSKLPFKEKIKWMNYGAIGYKNLKSYDGFCSENKY